MKYIDREKVIEAFDGEIVVTGEENANAVMRYMKEVSDRIKSLEPADVIPIDWIINYMQESNLSDSVAISKLLRLWEKEKDEMRKMRKDDEGD